MKKITFRCCKHLNHTKDNYIDCQLKNLENICAYWERGETRTNNGSNPRDVQFCRLRGRLNFKTACISGGGGECNAYDEEQRTVEIEGEEQ